MELEFAGSKGLLEGVGELAAENLAEHWLREKEVLALRTNPARVIRGKTSGGDYAVDMRMMLELLVPSVKDAEETDLRAEVPGIFRDFQKRLGAAPEQQAVDDLFVLQGQGRQFVRERENDMGIARGQQFGAARVKPAVARGTLTPRAMPVPAGNGELTITCLMGSNSLWGV